jgi:ABC-type lipoprotein release transport system permease subunit
MILFRIALRNLLRRTGKNLVVIMLIAVGVAAFFIGNAVLESSIGGIQRAFSENFTADLSISERSEQSFSLFGPDVPVIGEYTPTPLLVNASDIGSRIALIPGVARTAYVMSSPLLVEVGRARGYGLGLGAIGDEYFSMFPGLHFTIGAPPARGSAGWVVLTEEWAAKIKAAQGRAPAPGDKVQLSFLGNNSFTIREATLAGVIQYRPASDFLAQVVILDGRVLRALRGYAQTDKTPAPAAGVLPVAKGDVDSLFSAESTPAAVNSTTGQPSAPVSLEELKKIMSEAHRAGIASDASPLDHQGAWHFILVRTEKGANKGRVAAALRKDLSGARLSVQVRDWRGTAGAIALYVFLMQIVLYIGLFMLGGIVVILTMNSLVMSVFERTGEIGTMRAIGARRGFIRGLFIVETIALTFTAGVTGILLGSGAVAFLDRAGLQFNNQILDLVFGSTSLHPAISNGNIALSFVASLFLGAVAWVYPVRLALRIPPVRAIHTA